MPLCSYNNCNLPPWVIASRHFNDNPQTLELMGVRQGNRFLFQRLEEIGSQEERAVFFNDYMSVKFQLHQWEKQSTDKARKSIRNSYLRFLRGWGMESNSIEGAVLKGWVESRIGLAPAFHKARISGIHCDEYMDYAIDRTKGSMRTNAINSQLDLLFEYCQYELARKLPARAASPSIAASTTPASTTCWKTSGKGNRSSASITFHPSPPTRKGPGSSDSRSGR